jgi:hypothetical protein
MLKKTPVLALSGQICITSQKYRSIWIISI